MPWVFQQTSKSDGMIYGLNRCDFRDHRVRIPVDQPPPQHKRGLTLYRVDQGDRPIHCAPSRTVDGKDVCPHFISFRKRLSFPKAQA